MSEQKGSYAHVGLPGLRELFAYVDGRPLEEEKRDLEADLKVLTIIPKDPSEPVNMVHDVVAPHALRRAIEAEQQLTEKDATIKELEQQVKKWKSLAESKVTHVHYNDNEHLRKALEVARWDIKQIAKYPDDKEYSARFATLALEAINAALGEEASSLPNCPHCGKNDRLLPHWEKSNLWACIHCSQPFDANGSLEALGEGDKP